MALKVAMFSLAVAAAGQSAFASAVAPESCPLGSNATCGRRDQMLLQKDHSLQRLQRHSQSERGTCAASEVSRRRRAETMCACRRRSAPTCIDNEIQLEGSADDAIKVMSYNLFGWNAFNVNKHRKYSVMGKIAKWSPAVLGAQEVEKGGYGYDEVKDEVVSTTGLSHVHGSQFYNGDVVEELEQTGTGLRSGYWLTMTRFRHKKTNKYFLFFNSHWKHGYGRDQAEKVAKFVKKQRDKHNSEPAILVGDSNQFCKGHDTEAWKYLLGQTGSSPVIFEDALEHDQGKSFSDRNNPDCRVDLIFVSKGDWTVRQAEIDRDGMGFYGDASDHAPLMAELMPLK